MDAKLQWLREHPDHEEDGEIFLMEVRAPARLHVLEKEKYPRRAVALGVGPPLKSACPVQDLPHPPPGWGWSYAGNGWRYKGWAAGFLVPAAHVPALILLRGALLAEEGEEGEEGEEEEG